MDRDTIFSISTPTQFQEVALQVFRLQYEQCKPYRQFCDLLGTRVGEISKVRDIPFLPIEFFKSHHVVSGEIPAQRTFLSSGTTGSTPSKHHVTDVSLYVDSFTRGFERFYGSPERYVFLALLPSYLEREGSSLVYMVDHLIKASGNLESGFYLHNLKDLAMTLRRLEDRGQKTILIGVTYALLDLLEENSFQLKNTLVMETGGMKGKRKELIRGELHEILKTGFGISSIHSEYGMTELLSQAYSGGNGRFRCPPWMHVYTRDTEDALSWVHDTTGGLNIIDLANLHSCSFIATQDLGRVFPDGTFEVLGRFDSSDVRGCNLMVL